MSRIMKFITLMVIASLTLNALFLTLLNASYLFYALTVQLIMLVTIIVTISRGR